MRVGNELKKLQLRAAYDYLTKNPEKNLPKLMDWVDKYIEDDVLSVQREVFRTIINEGKGNWYQLIESLWTDIDDEVRKAMFENIVINANIQGTPQNRDSRRKYGCNVPWFIVLETLPFDVVDDIIEQAKNMGTFMFVFSEDEPLKYKEEVIALCNKHEDCQFMAFTGGSEIDEDFADQMLRVRNFIPTISITGSAEDCRLDDVMKLLNSKKLPYGTYCKYNEFMMEDVAREEFFDQIINWGAKFCWFFSSIPMEKDKAYDAIKKYRADKPLLTIHFCKDRNMIGGCIAGGRYYCCIDRDGNVRPCVFFEESDSNIKTKTLLEAYQSSIFMKYHDGDVDCKGII